VSNLLETYIKTLIEGPPAQDSSAQPEIEMGKLMPWANFESSTALKGRSGVGPGEDRLAEILGAEVQGQSESFDLSITDGPYAGKWEVKAPDNSKEIRPGTEGITAFGPINKTIRIAIDELAEFLEQPGIVELADASQTKTQFDKIKAFYEETVTTSGKTDAVLTLGGEITANRFEKIMDMLDAAAQLVTNMQGDLLNVKIDEKNYEVTPTNMLKISRLLGITDEDSAGGLGDAAAAASALASLNSKVFESPEALRTEWEETISADEVFDLSGVILVTAEGFMMIPSPYGEKIKFSRITQGKPKFKTPVKGASGEGVWGEGLSKDKNMSSLIKEEYQNEKKMLQEHANQIVRAQNKARPAVKRLIFEAFSSQEKDVVSQLAGKVVDQKWKKELEDKVEALLDKQAKNFFKNDHFYKAVADVWKQLMRVYAQDQFQFARKYTRYDVPLAKYRP